MKNFELEKRLAHLRHEVRELGNKWYRRGEKEMFHKLAKEPLIQINVVRVLIEARDREELGVM